MRARWKGSSEPKGEENMKMRKVASVACAVALAVAALAALPGMPSAQARAKPGSHREAHGKVPAPVMPIVGPVDTLATHAYIIEADTGAVLLDKGGDQRIPTASLSKVMTAYVVFGMLKEGRAKLTDELPISEAAWRTTGSKMFVPINTKVSIEQLIQGVLVDSGNDACVALAEGLAGSTQRFVELMNQKAKELGLTNSHFASVDGLPTPDHYMSERDLATLALRTINDFPQYYHYYSEKNFGFNNINQGNRNPLLYKEIGADGLKTGHTEESGYSLLGSVHRGNRRIILVLSGMPSMKARAEEGQRLAEWAFREFDDYKLFSAGQTVENAEIWLGMAPRVPLTVAKDLVVTMPRNSRKDLKVAVDFTQPVPAPVKKGQEIGKVAVTAPNMATVEAPLYAAADVPRMGPFGRLAVVAGHMIWGERH
jgi:D-alanyl-D-alanine carboxypeptidase (penicillin-binding protein 5/6)